MSATAFLQFLRQVHTDPAVPTFVNTLPSIDLLHDAAWQCGFVFTYKAAPQAPLALPACASDHGVATASSSHGTVDGFLRSVLEAGWPTREPGKGLPLLEVSTCVLAVEEPGVCDGGDNAARRRSSSSGSSSYHSLAPPSAVSLPQREYLVASRYELASTVFAVERYTVLAVPVDARKERHVTNGEAGCADTGDAEGLTVLGKQEASAALEEEQSLRALRAAGKDLAAAASLTGARTPAAELAELSFLQRQSLRVLRTVCRAISTAGGSVPDTASSVRHLQHLSLSASASPRGLEARFHAFMHSAVPFLGADELRRQVAWEHVQEADTAGALASTSAAGLLDAASSGGFTAAEESSGKAKANVNTTIVSNHTNTSATSEQGQTPAEGSRQPSTAQPHSQQPHQAPYPNHINGSGGGGGGGGGASVNTSMTSCDGATGVSQYVNGGAGVQIQWSLTAGEPVSASGVPVALAGVTPLPSLPRSGVPAAAPTWCRSSSAPPLGPFIGATAAPAAMQTDDSTATATADVFSQLLDECGMFFTPAALAQRRSHLHWQLDAVESIFATCPPYNHHALDGDDVSVTQGWQRWAAACSGGLSRPLIINSMDDIVAYCESSRQAFFAAVAMLDYFVVRTADDPPAACVAFMNFVRANRLQQQQHHSPGNRAERAFGPSSPGYITAATDKDISAFFTQVICVCCMLGCKVKDTYPPMLKKLLACLNSNSDEGDGAGGGGRFTDVEFTLMELFILQRVFHFSHLTEGATVSEVVDVLLFLVGGDAVKELTELNYYSRLLKRRAAESEWLDTQVASRLSSAEESLHRSRQDYLDAVEFAIASERRRERRQRWRRPAKDNEEDDEGGVVAALRHEEDDPSETEPCEARMLAKAAAAPMGCSGGACAPSVSKDEVREWHRLSLLARFISDLAVRGRKNTAGEVSEIVTGLLEGCRASQGGVDPGLRVDLERQVTIRLQCGALEVAPFTLAIAVLTVTAEVLRVPLPLPLFAILPPNYKRILTESGLAPSWTPDEQVNRLNPRGSVGENEESGLTAPSYRTSRTQQPEQTHGKPPSSTSTTTEGSTCFPVNPRDDHYLVLAHFCSLFARAQLEEMQTEKQDAQSTDDWNGYGADAPPQRLTDLEKAIAEVHKIYRESREGGPCDPILRKRYREMLAM